MLYREEQSPMALLRLKRAAQITLPVELRKQFNLEEGDYLEAEAVEDSILFKPVSVIERQSVGVFLEVTDPRWITKRLQTIGEPLASRTKGMIETPVRIVPRQREGLLPTIQCADP